MQTIVTVSNNLPPQEFEDFLRWVEQLKDDIPEEYRPAAKVHIDAGMDYDQPYAICMVTYDRPETPEETRQREAKARLDSSRQEGYERTLYEKLRKKFEPTK